MENYGMLMKVSRTDAVSKKTKCVHDQFKSFRDGKDVRIFLVKLGVAVLEHSSYTPHLPPAVIFLFSGSKESLKVVTLQTCRISKLE